jgi:glycosyltransferase involved in cell wall biosynthesis
MGGVKYLPHKPMPTPVAVEVPQLVDSHFHPAVIFEWGDDVPQARGGKRVVYAAPTGLEHARKIAARGGDAIWVPTQRARSLMIDAGVPASKIDVLCIGICGQVFTPDIAPYPFSGEGFYVLAFFDDHTSVEALSAMLETTAFIEPAATLIIATPLTGIALEGRLRPVMDDLARRGLHPKAIVASTVGSADGLQPSFFTACDVFLAIGGDPYAYGVLAAMASGSLIGTLGEAPANEFLTPDCALFAATPSELGRAIGRTVSDPGAAEKLRKRARFEAVRKYSAVKTACRTAALLRILYWGPSDGSPVAVTPESAAIAHAYVSPI